MREPETKRARGDGVEIQLAIWKGKGKQVLCIHGLTANGRCWDVMAEALTPQHQVLAMDLRGRGLSGRPPSGYSIQDHCQDIRALLAHMGLSRPVLMGHSLGAAIALSFGAQHPDQVDRIILVDGGGKLSNTQTAKVLAGIKPSLDRLGHTFPNFETYLDLMKQAPFLQPWTPFLETYYRYDVEAVDGGIRSRVRPEHIQEEISNLKALDVGEMYAKVGCPVLILRATEGMLARDDLLLPEEAVEEMLREIPDARCVDLEGTNHFSILFHRNGTRDRAILDFLGGLGHANCFERWLIWCYNPGLNWGIRELKD